MAAGGAVAGVEPISTDLLDEPALRTALRGTEPDAVFITAWMRRDTEAHNIEVNSAIMRNVLAAYEDDRSVRHVALVRGSSTASVPSTITAPLSAQRHRSTKTNLDYRHRTSTTPRRTNYSPPPNKWDSPGACTARTPSSDSRLATRSTWCSPCVTRRSAGKRPPLHLPGFGHPGFVAVNAGMETAQWRR